MSLRKRKYRLSGPFNQKDGWLADIKRAFQNLAYELILVRNT